MHIVRDKDGAGQRPANTRFYSYCGLEMDRAPVLLVQSGPWMVLSWYVDHRRRLVQPGEPGHPCPACVEGIPALELLAVVGL